MSPRKLAKPHGDYREGHTWSLGELETYDRIEAQRKQIEDQEQAELDQWTKR